MLTDEGVTSPQRNKEWQSATVRNILKNERYCGDVILQKTYITDPISKKVRQNNGELPKVFIKNNHVPIVSREIYERAQQERARRGSKRKVSKASITEQGNTTACML